MVKGLQIGTARFNRLWKEAEVTFRTGDYRRCLRILRIVARFGRPDYERFAAKDFARYVREARQADHKDLPVTRMSCTSLDELPGDDAAPEAILLKREEARREYIRGLREIPKLLDQGKTAQAKAELQWLSGGSPLRAARKWADKMLARLGEKP